MSSGSLFIESPGASRGGLQHHRDALSDADAHRGEAVAHLPPRHLVHQRDEEAAPGGAEGVAEAMPPPFTLSRS